MIYCMQSEILFEILYRLQAQDQGICSVIPYLFYTVLTLSQGGNWAARWPVM